MLAEEFEELFDKVVARPLASDGFQRNGKSLYSDDRQCQFAWIRGGGRLSVSGAAACVVGFRHSFLRGKSEYRPARAPHDAGDYPWLFSCEHLVGSKSTEWIFDPARLMSPPFERMVYSTLSVDEIVSTLTAQRSAFREYIAWAKGLSHADAHRQIALHTKDYWIARLWDEDYRTHLSI